MAGWRGGKKEGVGGGGAEAKKLALLSLGLGGVSPGSRKQVQYLVFDASVLRIDYEKTFFFFSFPAQR